MSCLNLHQRKEEAVHIIRSVAVVSPVAVWVVELHDTMRLFLLTVFVSAAASFQPVKQPSPRPGTRESVVLKANENKGFPNPFKEFGDMLSSMDDVIDDFLFKRMGNGEVFYGKRKFKPSGRPNTEGKYNGMGMSDKTKIDITREIKEERMERKRQAQKEREQRN